MVTRNHYRMEISEFSRIGYERRLAQSETVEGRRGNHKTPTAYSVIAEQHIPWVGFENPQTHMRTAGRPAIDGSPTYGSWRSYGLVRNEATYKLGQVDINSFMLGHDVLDAIKSLNRYVGLGTKVLTGLASCGIDVFKGASAQTKSARSRLRHLVFNTDFISGPLNHSDGTPRSRSRSQSFGDAWLEWQYGILPLIRGTAEVFDALDGTTPLTRVVTSAKIVDNFTSELKHNPNSGMTTVYTVKSTRSCRCFRYLRPDSMPDFDTSGAAFLEAAWDAVPWSFVIDWFIPINRQLSSWAPRHTRAVSGCDSIRMNWEYWSSTSPPAYGWEKYSIPLASTSGYGRKFLFQRIPNASFDTTALSLADMFAASEIRLNANRIANSVALLLQRLSKRN